MTNTPQKNNPLHGLTLEFILTELFNHYGWRGLFDKIAIDCFAHEQSIKSSLKFLRKTPWAREKVELLYGFMLREARRESQQVALREAAAQENNVNGSGGAESF